MRRSKETRKQYIYLIQEREFVNSNEQTYKIGRTKSLMNRMSAYPKDSELLMLCDVDDCVTAEQVLKDRFRKEFTEQRKYGCEYFSGDLGRMKSLISQTLFPTVKKTFKMIKPLPKPPIWLKRLSKKINPPSKPLPQLPVINISAIEKVSSVALSITKTNEKVKSTQHRFFGSHNRCEKCDAVFNTKRGLMKHLNKQYPCDNKCRQCGHATSSIRQLNIHIKAKHPETKIRAVAAALAREQELSSKQQKGFLKFQLLPVGSITLTLKKGFWITKKQVVFYSTEFHNVIVVYFDDDLQRLRYSCDKNTNVNEFYACHDMLQPEIDHLQQRIYQYEQEVIRELENMLGNQVVLSGTEA